MAETVILDIQVNNEEAVKNILAAKKELENLRKQQALYKDELDAGIMTEEEYNKAMTAATVEMEQQKNVLKANTAALKDNVRQMQSNEDSLVSMRSALKKATTEFDNLSKAEREGARGKELQFKIKQLTAQVTEAEEATGRFQRNVGNYKGKIMEAFSDMGGAAGGMINPIKNATGALGAMSKTPVIAILGLLVNIITRVISAMKSGEEATGRLSQAMSGFKAIGDVVNNVLVGMGNAIAWVVEKLSNLAASLLNLQNRQKDNQQLAKENLELQKRERNLEAQRAKDERDIAKLQSEVANTRLYNAKQRQEKLKQIANIEQGIMDRERNFARDQYNYIKKRNAQTATSKEEAEELNQAYIRYQQAETNYYNHMATVNKRSSTVSKQMTTAQVTGIKEVDKAQEEALKAEEQRLKDEQKAATETLRLRVELAEKWSEEEQRLRKEQAKANAEREIDEVRNSTASEAAKNKQIRLMRQKLEQDLFAIDLEYVQHRKDVEKSEEQRRKAATIAAIEEERQRIENELSEISSQTIDGLTQQIALRQQLIAQMYQKEGETAEQYRARQIAAEKELVAAEKDLADKRVEIEVAKYNALAGISGAISSILKEANNENEALTKAVKVFALAQIAFSTGEALAKGIASSQSQPFPANLVAMATTITAILTNIASAVSTVKGAGFSSGGYVQGQGTGTSDSINARLSNGESVMTAKATRMFYDQLSAMNVAGGGRAFPDAVSVHRYARGGVVSTADLSASASVDAMRRAFVDAVKDIHPVVSVSEINAVNNRVAVKERTVRR